MERKEMTDRERRLGAGTFVLQWKGRGYEKGETQRYWMALLRDVLGVTAPDKYISFEKQVKIDGHTKFIDGYIPQTRVLIEQKSINVVLTKKAKQSDGQMLTPFRQAVRYSALLPFDERPRWIVVSNFAEIHVHDMSRPDGQPEIIRLEDLPQETYRLEFLVRDDAEVGAREKEISVKAGELVGQLYDELLKGYKDPSSEKSLHSLNALCVQLVFCLYAEDSGIFGRKKMFHDYLARYASKPSDVREKILKLFEVLDTPEEYRDAYLDDELAQFPYVNGSLFAGVKALEVPRFSQEAVKLLLKEASEGFDWSEISPTIFGAVFESTLNPETRRKGGMHYTSVENIHKVIDPLFLNDLKDELARVRALKNAKERKERLTEFQKKLSLLTFLDPACGSGNFLTETYLSLRKLENEVVRIFAVGTGYMDFGDEGPVHVHIHQFYGIEINDFACAVAKTALWIAESQMLKQTEDIIKRDLQFLPLKSYTNIREGNALRMDWNEVVPREKLNYIMGNPPFIGRRYRNEDQTADVAAFFNYKDIDYVACWFKKAANLIHSTEIRCAFVATNSITQGEQVAPLWQHIFSLEKMKIDFAYRTFIWESKATNKAHVYCVIIGFSEAKIPSRKIFNVDGTEEIATNISPYLVDAPNTMVTLRSKPLCDVPLMQNGNVPLDGDALKVEPEDLQDFANCPYIKRLMGGQELLHNEERYVIWLVGVDPIAYMQYPKVIERVNLCRMKRLQMDDSTKKLASRAATFRDTNNPDHYIAMPIVSSENRSYIPMAYLNGDTIPTNQIQMVPGAGIYEFGVLESRVHMAWMRAVAGRLEMRYRYSKDVVYNNFVWPTPSESQRTAIEKSAQKILDSRKLYPQASLADLYGSNMHLFSELVQAHEENDKAVLAAYGLKQDATEAQIVAMLLTLYEQKSQEVAKNDAINTTVLKIIGKKAESIPDWLEILKSQCLAGTISIEELLEQGKAKKKEIAAAERKAKKEAKKRLETVVETE